MGLGCLRFMGFSRIRVLLRCTSVTLLIGPSFFQRLLPRTGCFGLVFCGPLFQRLSSLSMKFLGLFMEFGGFLILPPRMLSRYHTFETLRSALFRHPIGPLLPVSGILRCLVCRQANSVRSGCYRLLRLDGTIDVALWEKPPGASRSSNPGREEVILVARVR